MSQGTSFQNGLSVQAVIVKITAAILFGLYPVDRLISLAKSGYNVSGG